MRKKIKIVITFYESRDLVLELTTSFNFLFLPLKRLNFQNLTLKKTYLKKCDESQILKKGKKFFNRKFCSGAKERQKCIKQRQKNLVL